MCWIRFTRDFNWEPPEAKGRAVTAYKAGTTLFARKRCAEDALAAGAAVEVPSPRHSEAEPEAARPEDNLDALREEYEELAGEAPDGRWSEATLRDRIAGAQEFHDGEAY